MNLIPGCRAKDRTRTKRSGRLELVAGSLAAMLLFASAGPGPLQAPAEAAEAVRARVYHETGVYSGNAANAARAARILDGYVLKPGEVFSFNRAVGPRTRATGFVTGLLGDGSRIVGSGVCRTSTVLYQAAVKMGLDIVERHPHRIPVGYTPRGTDATVWYGTLDMRFRNSARYAIEIEMNADMTFVEAIFHPLTLARYPKAHLRVDGEPVEGDVAPILMKGRVLVPVRWISQALGAEVEWEGATRTVYVYSLPEQAPEDAGEGSGDEGASQAADPYAETFEGHPVVQVYLDGQVLEGDVPGVIMEGRTLVPVRWIAEGLGASLAWDQETRTVLVESGPKPEEEPEEEIHEPAEDTTEPEPEDATDPEPVEDDDIDKDGEQGEQEEEPADADAANGGDEDDEEEAPGQA